MAGFFQQKPKEPAHFKGGKPVDLSFFRGPFRKEARVLDFKGFPILPASCPCRRKLGRIQGVTGFPLQKLQFTGVFH